MHMPKPVCCKMLTYTFTHVAVTSSSCFSMLPTRAQQLVRELEIFSSCPPPRRVTSYAYKASFPASPGSDLAPYSATATRSQQFGSWPVTSPPLAVRMACNQLGCKITQLHQLHKAYVLVPCCCRMWCLHFSHSSPPTTTCTQQ